MSKKRDKEYGLKPQDVELKHEEVPQSPAKLRLGYCKKLKAEHAFELDEVITYKIIGPLERKLGSPLYIKGFTDYKIYRCIGCKKKKRERIRQILDVPALLKKEEQAS